jgi:acetone carboxylase gamma subunit
MKEQKTTWPKEVLKDLIDGKMEAETLRRIHTLPKDEDRFEKILEIEQERVPWQERIIVPLSEHLYVVLKGEEKIIKCTCGHEFGDYRRNWKLSAIVYERNPSDGEVYLGPRGADPDWMILREFYCPDCATQLEVEAVPPAYPIVFNAQLDIDGFYARRPELRKKILGE